MQINLGLLIILLQSMPQLISTTEKKGHYVRSLLHWDESYLSQSLTNVL